MFISSIVCVGNVVTFNGASHAGCIAFKITCYVFAILKRMLRQVELYLWSKTRSSATVCYPHLMAVCKGWWEIEILPKTLCECGTVELTTYCVRTSCRIEKKSCLLKLLGAFLTVPRIM